MSNSSIWLIYRILPLWIWEQWQWRGTPYYPNLAIRLFNVIPKTLVGGVLLLCRDTVSIFYSPNRLGLDGWYLGRYFVAPLLIKIKYKLLVYPMIYKNWINRRQDEISSFTHIGIFNTYIIYVQEVFIRIFKHSPTRKISIYCLMKKEYINEVQKW